MYKHVIFCFIWVFCPTREFSLIWRCHHCRWRAENYDLYSALMAIEQWGFFSVPHPLCHGASIYNGYVRGTATLTPSIWQWICHNLFYNLGLSRPGFEHPTFRMRRESSNRLCYCLGSLLIRIRNDQLICYINNVRPEFRQCQFEQLPPSKSCVLHSGPIDCLFIGVQLYRQWQSYWNKIFDWLT